MNNIEKLPLPKYLNLEYIFNRLIEIYRDLFFRVFGGDPIFNNRIFKIISIILSAIFVAGIIFLIYKILYLKRKRIFSFVEFFAEEVPETRTGRWDDIKKRIESEHLSDWKVAIMEADSLIDEIVKKIGYKGKSLGERLENIEPSDFNNLQNVWEAHKVRNRIVHEGDKFEINKDEARAVMEKYEKSLKEFKYI